MMGEKLQEIKSAALLFIMILLLTACESNSPGMTWQEQYDLGMQYLTEGDYEAAIVAFTAAIEIEPNELRSYTGLIQAYLGNDEYDSARKITDEAIEIIIQEETVFEEEDLDGFIIVAVESYETVDDVDVLYTFWISVLNVCNEAEISELKEEGAVAFANLGQIYQEMGNYEEAVSAFQKAIEFNSTNAEYYLELANSLYLLGNFEEAISVLNTGFEATGDEILNDRISELQEEYEAAEAEKSINELKEYIDQLDIQFTVDDIELGITDIEAAVETYSDRTGADVPTDSQGNYHLIWAIYGRRGNPIPEGYEWGDTEFKFSTMAADMNIRTINEIVIQSPDFLCLGEIRVGDDFSKVLEFFGVQDKIDLLDDHSVVTENNSKLTVWMNNWQNVENQSYLGYDVGDSCVYILAVDGKIHKITMYYDWR